MHGRVDRVAGTRPSDARVKWMALAPGVVSTDNVRTGKSMNNSGRWARGARSLRQLASARSQHTNRHGERHARHAGNTSTANFCTARSPSATRRRRHSRMHVPVGARQLAVHVSTIVLKLATMSTIYWRCACGSSRVLRTLDTIPRALDTEHCTRRSRWP